MKIKRLAIKNFRAITDFDEEFGSYTAFIGYNGGGKSSILHAVRWFFDDFELEPSDVFSNDPGQLNRVAFPPVKVTVTFDELSKTDRENFGPYVLENKIKLSREGGVGEKSKLYGERLICRDFTELRGGTKVAEIRKRLQELTNFDDRFSDLKNYVNSSKKDILKALDDWESNPKNVESLTLIENEDANHFFGAVGSEKLKADAGFVFIPAAPDLTGQFDVSGKGSAVQLLLGDILKGVVGQSISKWTEQNQEVLNQLEDTVKESAATRLNDRANKVNQHLERYLPETQIEFEVGLQDWAPKASPNAISKMRKGGREFPIEREGHGVQRATLLALLQATANSRSETPPTQEDDEASGLKDSKIRL